MDKQKELAQFTRAYVEALLWSSTDVVDGDDVHLDDERFDTSGEFDTECAEQCRAFFEANYDDLVMACVEYPLNACSGMEQTGHDFALTRNGHGTGFWDRGLSEELGARLTAASEAAGEVCPYVGDDDLIYI
jgi:hypothetical protein